MENPAPKPLFGKIPEEAFDHVQPGCTGRCEVHMKARVALQPVDDFLMFVRGVVVAMIWICLSFGKERLI